MIAKIVVDIKTLALNKPFSYLVPSDLLDVIAIGQRVIVPFNGRKISGIIVSLEEVKDSNLEPILELLDIEPVLNQELIELANNMHKYYFSLYINCLEAMIPPALRVKHEKRFEVINRDLIPLSIRDLFENDYLIYNVKYQNILSELKKGIQNGSLVQVDKVSDSDNIQFDTYIQIKNKDEKLSVKQQEIIDFIGTDLILKKQLIDNFSASRVKLLIDKGILEEIKKEKYRQFDKGKEYLDKKISLNQIQENALSNIRSYYGTNKTILLHGVTGSGKTEIYLNVIADMLEKNKTAILLVPEISLTPQIVSRIKGRFKENVSVLHSGLSKGEKYDEWRRIIKGKTKIVVGARSAIFAPIKNIGAIIIDEEHERSYIQESDPKYDARLIARIRARNHNAITILGSATPSIESYYMALNGHFSLIELNQRANMKDSPKVTIVNMQDEYKNGNYSILSDKLSQMIEDKLKKNEQVLLLLNRRGYSSFVMCRNCNEVFKCPHCDISLTYHKNSNSLKCHYCGYELKTFNKCPKCGGQKLRFMGLGTQKVSEEIAKRFSQAKVLRMDVDNTQNKGAHEKIITQFLNKEADILVGTQMISKGLDFPLCSLVGILSADQALRYPEFRATTDAYNLFVQTSGRAGRHNTEGDVLIQAYDVTHYALVCAKKENYVEFYNEEIKYRKLGMYPPFVKLIELLITGPNYDETYEEALKLMQEFKVIKDIKVLGPAEDYIVKIEDRYRFKITIKFKNDKQIDNVLQDLYMRYLTDKKFRLFITRS